MKRSSVKSSPNKGTQGSTGQMPGPGHNGTDNAFTPTSPRSTGPSSTRPISMPGTSGHMQPALLGGSPPDLTGHLSTSPTGPSMSSSSQHTSPYQGSVLNPTGTTVLGASLTGTTPTLSSNVVIPPQAPQSSPNDKVPTKSQQLLNKLKIGRKHAQAPTLPPAASTSAFSAPPPSITSLAASSMGSQIQPMPSQLMMPPAALPHGFSVTSKGADLEGEMEELSPDPSVPTNPLAPFLTPFRKLQPLTNKMTTAAVAGIKRPWSKRIASTTSAASASAGSARSLGTMPTMPSGGVPGAGSGSEAYGPPVQESDSSPPMGYLWVWMGRFRRWQRRFIVASEAPGVLLMYKRMNMKGKVLSISLRNVDINEDPADPRQLKIITPTGYIFFRCGLPEERSQWLACLRESQRLYRANQGLVERLKDRGLLPPSSKDLGTPGGARAAGGNVMNSLPDVTDMDLETRKRVRARVAERLTELAPFQKEVERHMSQLSSQLLSVVSALHVRLPGMTPSSSMMRVTGQYTPSTGPSHLQPAVVPSSTTPAPASLPLRARATAFQAPGHTTTTATALSEEDEPKLLPDTIKQGRDSITGHVAQPVSGGPDEPVGPVPALAGSSLGRAPSDGSDRLGAGPEAGGLGDVAAAELPPTGSPRAMQGASSLPQELPGLAAADRMFSASAAIKAHMRPVPGKAANLQQAFAQLLDAVRYGLHSQALRISTLEAENIALQSALALLKQQQGKAWRSRTGHLASAGPSGSYSGAGAGIDAAAAAAGGMPAGAAIQETVTGEDDSSICDSELEEALSVMTADEDAFDVTEAFDEGVDYSVLDRPDDEEQQEGQEDGADVMQDAAGCMEVLSRLPSSSKRTPGSSAPVRRASRKEAQLSDGPDGRSIKGGSDVENAASQEQAVLNALEVVRQVEYVERTQGLTKLAQKLATHEPPDVQPTDDNGLEDDGAEEEEEEEEEEDGDRRQGGHHGRMRLPAPRPLGKGFSIWSLLKNMIGKDLTRLTMPATINEPTSTLQRLAESIEYYALLNRAAAEQRSIDRLMLVTVWKATCYNSQPLRDGKPFNPLLGETYEWQSHDGDVRYVCEQVSHHPPVLAYVAGSSRGNWEMQGELETKSKFWGKSAEVLLWGCEALKLKQWGDEFRWNRATICVQDIILGSYWIETYGKVRVSNTHTGETAQLTLKPCKRRMQDRGKLEGTVYDAQGKPVWVLSGSCTERVYAQLTPEGAAARGLAAQPPPELIWEKSPYPPDAAEQYWFTWFALGLNDPADKIVPYLPPTDTRFRPDQRALEVGEWNRATTEKLRLEEKQRQVRRERAKAGVHYKPAWFTQVDPNSLTHLPDQAGFAWNFTGEYWQRRAERNWSDCYDLYSVNKCSNAIPKIGAQPPSP